MAGTIPLMSQVPANDPMSSRIKSAGNASFILDRIPSSNSDHEVPLFMARIEQNAADNNKAIWFAPDRESSP